MAFVTCSKCNEENPASARHCVKCGAALSALSSQAEKTYEPSKIPPPVTKPQPSKSNTARNILVLAVIAVILLVVSQMGFYTIQPIGAIPQGVTLLVWRASDEPFFNFPDAVCIKIQDGVSLLCRAMAITTTKDRITTKLRVMTTKL
jgi:hypothetical protein